MALIMASTMGGWRQSLAQGTGPGRTPHAKAWHTGGNLRVEQRTDNNVFLLSDSARIELGALTAPRGAGGRYADMQSVADYVTRLRGGLGIEGPGLAGRKLSLRFSGSYDLYAQNSRHSSGELGLSIAQWLPLHGRLTLRARLAPGRFARNFMSDAVDLNGDGAIQSSERIFAPATYRNTELSAAYRQQLKRPTSTHPFGLAIDLEAGHLARTYAAPFAIRSYRGPVLSATLRMTLTRSVNLDVGYTRASLDSRPGPAVLRLNEPDFGVDFNGNGATTDSRIRTVQLVDFSRREQYFDARLRAEVAHHVILGFRYQHRWRRFPSALPFDVLNNSRRDRRDLVGAELRWQLPSGPDLRLGVDYEVQKSTGPLGSAPIGVTDYTRRRLYAGLGFHL